MRFTGKTVVVTGASRGLGREIAAAFGAEGAHVCLGYRSHQAEAEESLREVVRNGGSGELLRFDLRDRGAIDEAVDSAVESRGGIDVLVNNAGLARDAFVAMMSPEEWDDVLSVNLTGLYNMSRAVLRPMMARRQGAIVNLASVAGLHASVGQANYAASKGGVLALTRTLAAEMAPYGIRVNSVVPGLISTGMAQRLDRKTVDEKVQAIPLKRLGAPAEVARLVLFLASEEASYIVGQAVVVDGGMTL